MSAQSVLITGGNGYLGVRLADRILRDSDYCVQLLVHASSASEFEEKAVRLKELFQKPIAEKRLLLLAGELSDEQAFSAANKSSVKQIIHSAAVTRFNVDAQTANLVNVEGSRNLLSFAADCPQLESVQFLSTVYASGLRQGIVLEQPMERANEFSNHYERSKWEAEHLLATEFNKLPVNTIRIATLIADSNEGVVTQQNAFHNTLKLFYYGLLSLFPGDKNTPIYFVTGDFVVDSIFTIFNSGKQNEVFHVCHNMAETAKLEGLVDVVFETFEQYRDFKIRRVLRPLWADVESFDLLSQGIESMSSGVMSQAVSSVSPFSRQLFAPKDFRNDNLRAIMSNYQAPDPRELIKRTACYLADTKWGRQLQHAN